MMSRSSEGSLLLGDDVPKDYGRDLQEERKDWRDEMVGVASGDVQISGINYRVVCTRCQRVRPSR